mmetsp:Transcript_18511/g.20652  ORF Transcript_18511/g.20652 Transcript_18511/m.20652 type:complete len:125 (+) Transcript_18511:22-396(+)|eukprot:CAMPEP_0205799538 /NCGR_PEP_ID=MMETSP0205-20121125/833_1 /ASSEMBLY_ACC=CAM_ASM_000278 /TAXON_ID=36767 /ORGANISM="Euplotes focardii, Strain TN1" /LENGTH=124 /DNA_ID=CAMNT_0053060999 /DNA_START=20 /DNA_END=394 /DNA_ORIENTATION=+
MENSKGAEILQGRKKDISIVAEDQNWRSYIHNELKCAEIWQKDWGFLSDKGDGARPDKELTKEEKIRQLEEELKKMNDKKLNKLQTTNLSYGTGGDDLERFRLSHLNKRKQEDLQPVPRRPKKG